MRSRSAILSLLVALSAALGCSSSESDEGTDEGAVEGEVRQFNFRPNSPQERAGEIDENNAYWAAKLSAVAYDHEDDASLLRGLRALNIPVEEAFVFNAKEGGTPNPIGRVSGTSGMYVRTRQAGFLVFRGSEDGKLNDALVNAGALPLPTRLGINEATQGTVHAGFHTALHSVWSPLRDKLKKRHGGNLPLYVMGHSLGGALATLATHQLLFDECLNSTLARVDLFSVCKDEYVKVAALYTLGAPRVGNEEFTTMLAKRTRETKTPVFRFVNEGDQVSMLPRYTSVGDVIPYRHIGEKGDEKALAIMLKKDGSVLRKPQLCSENPQLVQCDLTLLDAAGALISGALPWKVEHARGIYLEKLRAKVTKTPMRPEALKSLGE